MKQPASQSIPYPRRHLIAVAVCSVAVFILAMMPSVDATATKTLRLPSPVAAETSSPLQPEPANSIDPLEAPVQISPPPVAEPVSTQAPVVVEKTTPVEPIFDWRTETVRKGDTLSHIFARVGFNSKDVYEVMNSGEQVDLLTKIHPGQQIEFAAQGNQLLALRFKPSKAKTLLIQRVDGDLVTSLTNLPTVAFTSYAQGTISSSLFLAAKDAGLSESVTMELANIFGWDIDFVFDIREGDHFQVIYQELTLNGEKIRDGDILAAQFTNKGKTYTAFRFETSDQRAHYFTPEGDSMRKAFLRSPIDFARISSHFNMFRRHPVLHTIRAHKGTDYAASRGTPIKATGDGKVAFVGRKGGYGNVVILQHGQTYKTLYAHMNGFARGIKTGRSIRQGQVIGYVGSTGLATGPHLHYEFYVNGSVRNPVTVKLPNAKPISPQDRSRFLAHVEKMQGQLATYAAASAKDQLASLPSNNAVF